jgi:hypothetical protein
MSLKIRPPAARRAIARTGVVVSLVAAVSIVCLHAARNDDAPDAGLQTGPGWNAFRADIEMSQRRVTAAGQVVGVTPPRLSLHLERTRGAKGWKTAMTLNRAERAVVQTQSGPKSLDNPFLLGRIEFDEADGRGPRFYNQQGQEVPDPAVVGQQLLHPRSGPSPAANPRALPPVSSMPVAANQHWMDAVIATPDGKDARRHRFEQQFGPQSGTSGRLRRFVLQRGADQQEVLVDPDTELPVDVTLTSHGALVRHTHIGYATYAGGVLARKSLQTEAAIPDSSDHLVTDIELSNISVDGGVMP